MSVERVERAENESQKGPDVDALNDAVLEALLVFDLSVGKNHAGNHHGDGMAISAEPSSNSWPNFPERSELSFFSSNTLSPINEFEC